MPGFRFSQTRYQTPSTIDAQVLRQLISSWFLIMRASSMRLRESTRFFTPALTSASRALPSKLPSASFSPSRPRFSSSALISPAKALASSAHALGAGRAAQPRVRRPPLFDPRALIRHLMKIAVVLVHHRIMLGEEQHVAAHRISKTAERGQVTNVVMIGFEQRGDAVLFHDHLRPLHALVAHALGIEPLLPIRGFRTEGEFR